MNYFAGCDFNFEGNNNDDNINNDSNNNNDNNKGCDFNFEGKLVGCEGKGEGGADPIGGGVGNIGSKTSTQCSKHCSTMLKTLFNNVQNINKLFNIDADSVQY